MPRSTYVGFEIAVKDKGFICRLREARLITALLGQHRSGLPLRR